MRSTLQSHCGKCFEIKLNNHETSMIKLILKNFKEKNSYKFLDLKELNLVSLDLYWSLAYHIAFSLGGVVLIKFLTVSMSTSTYGQYLLYMSALSLIILFPFSALIQGMSRIVPLYERRHQVFNLVFAISLVFSLFIFVYVTLVIYLSASNTLPDFVEENLFYCILFGISEFAKTFIAALCNARIQRKILFFSTSIEFGAKSVFIYFYQLDNLQFGHALLAFGIINLFVASYAIYFSGITIGVFSRRHFFHQSLYIIMRVTRFALPLVIWAPFSWMREMANRWYLNHFLDVDNVAKFSVIMTIAMILPLALQNLFSGYLIPYLYRRENKQKGSTIKTLNNFLISVLMLIFITFIVIYLLQEELVSFITAEKYTVAAWMLPWMFLTYSIYVLSMVYSIGLFAENKTKLLILPNIVPGILSLILGYFLIKYFGMVGAFINYHVTFLSYSLLIFLTFKFIRNN